MISLKTSLLLLSLFLIGCLPKELPPLPEPATNNKLSNAERDLDKITEERLSMLSAQIGVSLWLAEQNEKTNNNLILINELNISKNLLGRASNNDWTYAKQRVEYALKLNGDTDKIKLIYNKENQNAETLVLKIKEADSNYEKEKSKKQAEYEAKVTEREQLLAQERIMAKIKAEEDRKDDFLYLGGVICIISTFLLIFYQNKISGLIGMACGMLIASIGRIWATDYFNYFLALIFVSILVFILIYFYRLNKNKDSAVDNK